MTSESGFQLRIRLGAQTRTPMDANEKKKGSNRVL